MNFLRVLFVLTASSAFAQPSTTAVPTRSFPPVGLAPSETLQINLYNAATASSTSTSTAAPLCTGSVSFFNANGVAVGTSQNYSVPAGQIVSIKLPPAPTALTGRPEYVATVTPTESNARCALVTTLEVYGTADGVTHLHLGGAAPSVRFGFRR